jgi:hypothetical protein
MEGFLKRPTAPAGNAGHAVLPQSGWPAGAGMAGVARQQRSQSPG